MSQNKFKYQKDRRYFAQVAGGMEDEAILELQELGATNTEKKYRGVEFEADRGTVYQINYCSRLVTRILAPLASFKATEEEELYQKAKGIAWEEIFGLTDTFKIYGNINIKSSEIYHSRYASLQVKDAIADRFRNKFGKRPDVDTNNPEVVFNLYIQNDIATISLDTSGESLHKRGYRKSAGKAPMQETLAAVIVRLSEWKGENQFIDPMCGSGTILCEALMKYCNIPSGYLRSEFGFQYLPDYDQKTWKKIKQKCDAKIRSIKENKIQGIDISPAMIKMARRNCQQLPYGDKIGLTVSSFQSQSDLSNKTIVTNPPFGVRMGNKKTLKKLYTRFSKKLKKSASGSKVLLYCGKPELLDYIWMKEDWQKELPNGGIEGQLVQYQVY